MNGPETRLSLLMRLRDPDRQQAWEEFVSVYWPIIFRMAQQRGLQHSDAEDACQQVMTTVSQSIDSFQSDPSAGSFRGWLHRITRNLLINNATRDKSTRGTGDSAVLQLLAEHEHQHTDASTAFDVEHRRAVFHWAADRVKLEVSEESWSAFWRTYVDGESIADVAEALGKRAGTVRVARCRVFARIRKQIEQHEQDFDTRS